MNGIVLWTSLAAGAVGAGRWLRVAQREHYGVGRTSRFARRWWLLDANNRVLLAIAAAGVVLSGVYWWAPSITAAAVVVGPRGLEVRGRTSPLAWTRRLITVAAMLAILAAAVVGIGLLVGLGAPTVAVLLFGLPLWTDAALAILAPFEALLARRWIRSAQTTLDRVDPVRVAVTGSYGKTTIKGYLRHLLTGTRSTVATPASFNNMAGLCRAVNEHLTPGTEVFIAEMGTFGPGEIAAMTRWVNPSVSILASIGPVHLERFGSLDRIVSSKAEIFATSRTAIINIDAHGLLAEADRLAASGLRVIRCSTQDADADVTVLAPQAPPDPLADIDAAAPRHSRVTVFGREIANQNLGHASAANVACAVAAAHALGVADAAIAARLGDLRSPEHRRTVARSESGVVVIDDTYNSNPAGARAALELLCAAGTGRRVLVTPGMVELGRSQAEENRLLAELAAQIADDVIIVGRTNRTALLCGATGWDPRTARAATRGRRVSSALIRASFRARAATRGRRARSLINDSAKGSATVRCVAARQDAVRWVRTNLRDGDAVLYENDLPDHYP